MNPEALFENGAQLSTVGIFVWFVLIRAKMHIKERTATLKGFTDFLENQRAESLKLQAEMASSLKDLAVELGAMRVQNTTEHGEIIRKLHPAAVEGRI